MSINTGRVTHIDYSALKIELLSLPGTQHFEFTSHKEVKHTVCFPVFLCLDEIVLTAKPSPHGQDTPAVGQQ